MTSIRLENLKIIHNHGFYQEEKVLGQLFILDLTVDVDMDMVMESHRLEDTINYGVLAEFVEEVFTRKTLDLIENAGDLVCREVLNRFCQARSVSLRLKKPWAPVGKVLDSPQIILERKWERVFLGLGTNMGDKEENLNKALDLLKADSGIRVEKVSSFMTTKAWGVEDQDDFLNGAVEIRTYYRPLELLDKTQAIEKEVGRTETYKWGPRMVDLDMLYYGDKIIYEDRLKVPHPYIGERAFVLEPLAEIGPFFVDPVIRLQLRQMLDELKAKEL